jgi:hypothetical protein
MGPFKREITGIGKGLVQMARYQTEILGSIWVLALTCICIVPVYAV